MKELLKELQALQNEATSLVNLVSEENYHEQFHPDLSPIGWHLGHCIYTETYWIKEELLGQQTIDDSLKSLYVPELSHKASRGSVLPEKTELLKWAEHTQTNNRILLEQEIVNKNPHHLLENNYLLHFLIQHYSQHLETMAMVLTEMQLKKIESSLTVDKNLISKEIKPETKTIDAGFYSIGSNNKNLSYDNERPEHDVKLNHFKVESHPVSNSQYQNFINDDAYSEKKYWSDEGWQWINSTQFKHPHHWRLGNNSFYYGVNYEGMYELNENDPVYGLSYYEAEAFANWSNARLPHEHEWEVAKLKNLLQQDSLVWEWCNNSFYPYENFSAYPYEGYSVPYFDGKHYVLRGGSRNSKDRIKHASFRNYYTADKRHIFAGLRLVYD